ncbi:MAG: hypothetical protein AAGB46_09945 [Verrucomicrobiota bacterium]
MQIEAARRGDQPISQTSDYWSVLLAEALPAPDVAISPLQSKPGPLKRLLSFYLALSEGSDAEIVGTGETLINQWDLRHGNTELREQCLSKFKTAYERLTLTSTSGLSQTYIESIQYILTQKLGHDEILQRCPWLDTPILYNLSDEAQSQLRISLQQIRSRLQTPIIFCSRFRLPWNQLFQQNNTQPFGIFCNSLSTFYAQMSDPRFSDILKRQETKLFISELYPTTSYSKQGILGSNDFRNIEFIFMPHLGDWEARSLELQGSIAELAKSAQAKLSPIASKLYAVCLECLESEQTERLGLNFSPELRLKWRKVRKTETSYLQKPNADQHSSPSSQGLFQNYLESLKKPAPRRTPLPSRPKPQLRIAHLIPQLVDPGDESSKLLRALAKYGDPNRFSNKVYFLESYSTRAASYPQSGYNMAPSVNRSPIFLKALQASGVEHAIIRPGQSSLEESGRQIAAALAQEDYDILIGHSDDPLTHIVVRLSDIPAKAFIKRRELPSCPNYDAILCSIESINPIDKRRVESWGTRFIDAPKKLDCRTDWPPQASDLDLPAGYFAFTTISDRLEDVLEGKFLESVAAILCIYPNSVYMPIGKIRNSETFISKFKFYGVSSRTFPLGPSSEPSHLCRSMKLYLNEFPNNAAAPLLAPLAAGIPIISMAGRGPDAEGSAAIYIEDPTKLIANNDSATYVSKAIELIDDPDKWNQYSEYSLSQYETHGPRSYAERYEEIFRKLSQSKVPL